MILLVISGKSLWEFNVLSCLFSVSTLVFSFSMSSSTYESSYDWYWVIAPRIFGLANNLL